MTNIMLPTANKKLFQITKEANMAKKTKITDYLPQHENTLLVQAKIKEALHRKVREKLKAQGCTLQDLIVASFEKYLTESQGE